MVLLSFYRLFVVTIPLSVTVWSQFTVIQHISCIIVYHVMFCAE